MRYILFIFSLSLLLISCSDRGHNISITEAYDGPIMEVEDMVTLFSDSAKVKYRLTAAKELDFENGDKEFPEGVYIEFFEENKITTTLKANVAFYYKKEDMFTGIGDVIVKSATEKQQLNTEELHWTRKNQTVFTEKFVRIETSNEILMGEGLTAHEDLKTYTIHKPTGEINNLDEN